MPPLWTDGNGDRSCNDNCNGARVQCTRLVTATATTTATTTATAGLSMLSPYGTTNGDGNSNGDGSRNAITGGDGVPLAEEEGAVTALAFGGAACA